MPASYRLDSFHFIKHISQVEQPVTLQPRFLSIVIYDLGLIVAEKDATLSISAQRHTAFRDVGL